MDFTKNVNGTVEAVISVSKKFCRIFEREKKHIPTLFVKAKCIASIKEANANILEGFLQFVFIYLFTDNLFKHFKQTKKKIHPKRILSSFSTPKI